MVTHSNNWKEKYEFLKYLISVMPGNIYWKDRNGMFLGCNDHLVKIHRLKSPEAIVGLDDYDMLDETAADIVVQTDNMVMISGEGKNLEEKGFAEGKRPAIYLTRKVPIRDKNNYVTGMAGISIDITARKQAEEKAIQFEKENAAMEAKLQAIKTISASMAHELRTPLRTISSSASSLKKYLPVFFTAYEKALEAKLDVPPLPPRIYQILQNALDNIDSEANDAFTVINMLMIAAGMGQAMVDHEPTQTCSAAKCIESALQRYPYDLDEKELVHWQIDQSNPKDFEFNGKELLVVHIFFNLLKNAFYHIKKADKGEIFIWLENDGKNNIIHFKDTGSGIPAEIVAHIFDQFYSNTLHGTGIGLTFCKMTMQNLGGDIICLSREGEFTEFALRFPLK